MADASLARYARQITLPEVGVNGQQMLCDSSALVIGVGGLGSPAALYLAAAGVGRIVLADRDRVELTNLQRQIIFRESDLGRDKVTAAAAQLTSLNASVDVQTHHGRLTDSSLHDLVAAADVVLDCTDNFPTRFAINAACVTGRRPLVVGAGIGLDGQVLVVDPRQDTACYACWFGESGADAERCEDAGILGPVVGMVGSLQALLAIRLLTGADVEAGRLQNFDARTLQWRSVRGQRDPHCRVCGGA